MLFIYINLILEDNDVKKKPDEDICITKKRTVNGKLKKNLLAIY